MDGARHHGLPGGGLPLPRDSLCAESSPVVGRVLPGGQLYRSRVHTATPATGQWADRTVAFPLGPADGDRSRGLLRVDPPTVPFDLWHRLTLPFRAGLAACLRRSRSSDAAGRGHPGRERASDPTRGRSQALRDRPSGRGRLAPAGDRVAETPSGVGLRLALDLDGTCPSGPDTFQSLDLRRG